MKFYNDKNNYLYWFKTFDYITQNKLSAIYMYDKNSIAFYINGILHNKRNAAVQSILKGSEYYLNDKCYGTEDDFTKKSWRRFIKLQAFL